MGAVITTLEDGRIGAEIDFRPSPVVREFVEDSTFVTGYFGPFGCGKTTAGAWKVWAYGQLWPGARIAVIRSTWPALQDTTQRTFFEWFPDGICGTYRRTAKIFELRVREGEPPVEVLWRGLDEQRDVDKVLSLDLAAVWIDEPQGGIAVRRDGSVVSEPGINHDLYLAILGRCGRQRGFPKMLWMTGNPPGPTHWIAREFRYSPGASHRDPPSNPRPNYRLYLGDQSTNRRNLPPRYYEDLEDLYGTGTPMARRFLHGEWIEFAMEAPFHADWIRYWEDAPPLSELRIEAGFDPAISQRDRSAQSALVVAGMATSGPDRGQIYVLHARAGYWSVYEQVDALLGAVVRWRVRTVRIEDVQYQRALGEVLEHQARQRGITVHIDLAKPDGDKLRRANAWSAWVEAGRVLFNPDPASGIRDLVDALLAVPADPTRWDLVDAAGLCVRGFPAPQGEAEPLPGHEPSTEVRAASYATRPQRPVPVALRPTSPPVGPAPGMRLAAGYAVRVQARPAKVGR